MINVFQLADNDQSIVYLGQVFGNVGFALAGTGPALLATMFKVFNTALLAIGALMVTYTTVMGVLATAQEGEFLGKKWHALWVPLRMLMGIAALFPTGSGYCAIQVIVMWVIIQGVGAADMVWKATVVYLGKGGTLQVTTPEASDPVNAVPSLVQQLFANSVCQAALAKFSTNDANTVARATFDSERNTYSFGYGKYPSVCGTASWPAPGLITKGEKESDAAFNERKKNATEMEDSQRKAMQTVVPVVQTLANHYVNSVIDDQNCWVACRAGGGLLCPFFDQYAAPRFNKDNKSCIINQPDTAWSNILAYAGSNFVTNSVRLFYGYATNYAATHAQQSSNTINGTTIEALNDAYSRAQANGWIFAGAYYFYIAAQNNPVKGDTTAFIVSFGRTGPNTNSFNDKDNILGELPIGPIYESGEAIANNAESSMSTAQNYGKPADLRQGSGAARALGSVSDSTIKTWAAKIAPTDNTNPIVRIQDFGQQLLIGAEALFWVFFGISVVMGLASTPAQVFGTTVNYLSGIAGTLYTFFLPIVLALLGYLITIGGLLGVYTPLIPYIYFTFGAIAWFLAVIDAMVAAPLIAIGILSPGGQHEMLGRAEPAVMILLNVFLRPTLMVFGMMAGMLLSYVVIRFINAGFYTVVGSITTTQGLIQSFLFIMAYAGLVITALNKCFALIYILPDQVLRWIGGHAEGIGEKAAEAAGGEAKGKVGAGAEAGGAAAKGAAGSGESIAKAKYGVGKGRGGAADVGGGGGGNVPPPNG